MRKLNTIWMGLFVLLILFLSQSISAQGTVAYFPLNIGNEWTFQFFSGNIISEAIVDTQRSEGILYYKFDQFRQQPEVLFGRAGEQVFRYIDTTAYLWYDFSADTGDSWIAHESEGVDFTVILLSKSDTVTTPAGTFPDCYHFYFAGIVDNEWEEWFAPGTGIVKRILHGFAYMEWELIDHIITALPNNDRSQLLETFVLYQNYPNPFNPETEIRFHLPQASRVVLKIYNALGQEVCTLSEGTYEAGYRNVKWDGKDSNGNAVASGIYLYRIMADDFIAIKKMMLIR
jgi:hypothetical protein